MESESHCPACLKSFQGTNKLLCGHVFCPECVSKTETLAQKTSTKPVCPVCLCEFTAASKEKPHPNSPYHDELVSRSDPKRKKECSNCDYEPSLHCEDGCGLLCEECQEKFHSKMKKSASHKVVALLGAGNTHGINLCECILHNLPIISICNQCWPVSEMCATCGYDDSTSNKSHEHVKLETIKYEAIKEDELIEEIQKKITNIAEKNEKVEIEMKKISREEEEQLEKVENLYNDIVQKASQLRAKLTETVHETFRPKSELIGITRHRMETSDNILKHSIAMLKEAKEIYEREKIVTKLFKSAIFARKAIELDVGDVETIELGNLKEAFSLSGYVLIDGNGARLLDVAYVNMKSEYEKCAQEIEQLKKENEEWQKLIEEKDIKLKNADERMQTLENEAVEYRKIKEKLAQIEKQKGEEKAVRERMVRDVFNRAWRSNIKDYKFQNKIGSKGSGNQQFNYPRAITVHPKTGHIYVAEDENHRVQVLDENLNFIRVFGSNGSGSGQLNCPKGIAISLDGHIAVSEYSGNRIQIFDEKDTVIATIQSGQKKSQRCTQTTDFDGFSSLYYICFDVEGNLYVSNCGKNRVDKFNRDFEFEFSFAQSSLGDSGIKSPEGICMNSKNEVCVVGQGGDKINFYDTNGTFIRTLKIQKMSHHASITEGPNNTILVSACENDQIRAYDSTNGSVVHTFGSGQSSKSDGQFNAPRGMCFGLNQKLYVADYSNHRIQMFSA